MTISTRSHERGYNYPAIFVDVSKIPVTRSECVSCPRMWRLPYQEKTAGEKKKDRRGSRQRDSFVSKKLKKLLKVAEKIKNQEDRRIPTNAVHL